MLRGKGFGSERLGEMALKALLAVTFVLLIVVPMAFFVRSLGGEAEPLSVLVQREPFEVRVEAAGKLEALKSEEVTVKSRGQVLTWLLPEGQMVKKGDLLCQFDDAGLQDDLMDQKINLQIAEARQRQAEETLYANEEDLKARTTMLEADLAIAETELQRLQGLPRKEDLERSRLDLAYAVKNLETATAELDRLKVLVEKGLVMSSEVKDKEMALASAQADKATAEIRLKLVEDGATRQQLETARLKMEQVKIDLEQARKELPERLTGLQANVEKSQAEVEKAHNRLDNTQSAIADTRVTSPCDGMLVCRTLRGRKVQLGDSFWWAAQLFDVVDLSHMRVKVKVLESDVRSVKEGQPVQVRVVTVPDKVLTGKVTKVVRVGKDKSEGELMTWSEMRNKAGVQAFDVEVTLDESDPRFRPNVGATVSILVDSEQNVVSVPLEAVTREGEQAFVHVLRGMGARKRPVKLGTTGTDWVVVSEGLESGERVLLTVSEVPQTPATQTNQNGSQSGKTEMPAPAGKE